MYWLKDFFTGLWLALTFNKKRMLFTGLGLAILLAALVLSLPLKTVTLERIETYYETEIRQETYPVSEAYDSVEMVVKTLQLADGYYTVVPFGIVFPFKVEKDETRITGSFKNSIAGKFYITTIGDKSVWEIKGTEGIIDVNLPKGEYSAIFREDVMWGEDCYIYLTLQWGEYETITKYRTTNTVKSVPVMVEKQKLVTETMNIPLWKYFFSKS